VEEMLEKIRWARLVRVTPKVAKNAQNFFSRNRWSTDHLRLDNVTINTNRYSY
jgi:hypothetical protein